MLCAWFRNAKNRAIHRMIDFKTNRKTSSSSMNGANGLNPFAEVAKLRSLARFHHHLFLYRK